MLKRIGFVDQSLENFHANTFHHAISTELKSRGFVVSGCTAIDRDGGKAWGEKKSVPYFDDVAAMARAVDYFMILAPSDASVHLQLCQQVFPFGRPTYVDKTFAPDLATAQEIFALADEHGVAVQTSSALRYTNVQQHVAKVGRENVRHMVAWGAGSSFAEYAIHPVELVVSCMGPGAMRVLRRGRGKESQILVDFDNERTAVINVYCDTATDFAASVTTASETSYVKVDGSRLFIDTAAGILDFFDADKPLVDREESLTIRKILDAAESD